MVALNFFDELISDIVDTDSGKHTQIVHDSGTGMKAVLIECIH